MKSEIHALIASLVSNQEIPSENKDYSVSTITEAVSALVEAGNKDVPYERKVTLKSALIVAERSLVASANRNFETRALSLVRDVTNFITLSKDGRVGEFSPTNTDLLSIGHPFSTAPHFMEESEFRLAKSRWIASDPRISEEYRSLVASAYAADLDSVEQDFAIARLQSLPAGSVPSEIIVASAIKSLVAVGFGFNDGANRGFWRRQWRDKRKRFAKMGRFTKVDYKDKDGKVKSFIGPFVGTHTDPNFGKILVKGDPNVPDRIYLVPSDSAEMVMGELSEDVLKKAGIDLSKQGPSGEVSKSFDKDIPNLKDIQTLPITDEDSNLAKPIAQLPAGMKAVYGLENVGFDDTPDSFVDKLMFNTEADIPLVDQRVADFLKSNKSLAKALDSKKFGKYLSSNSPILDALNDFDSGKLDKKDLTNLLSEASLETAPGNKNKELSNVLQALSDYFESDYDPKDYLDKAVEESEDKEPEIDGFDYSKANDSEYVDSFLDGFDNGVYAREKEEDANRTPSQKAGYEAGQALGEAKYDESLEKAQQDFPQYGQPEQDSESRTALNEARDEVAKPIYDSLEKLQKSAEEKASNVTEEEKVIGQRFTDWTFPSMAYPIQNDKPYEVSGAISQIYGADATDDPKILANMFDKAKLSDALFESIAGDSGDGTLTFPQAGEVSVPAEAIYDAMLENNFDADAVVAEAYDAVLGNQENTNKLNSFRKSTVPIGQIAELDKDSLESRTASELNVAIASQKYAKQASDLIESFKTLDDPDMDIIVDAIRNADLSKGDSDDYLERPVAQLISEFLPWAFSNEEGKRQAFRGMLGIVATTDGNQNLMFSKTTGIINQIYKNSEFYDNNKSSEENLKTLSDAVYPDGISYDEFIRSRAKVAIGEEDPNSPESYAGATYKLTGKLSQDYTTQFGFQRGFLTPVESVVENYTKKGSVVSFDMRPFTEDPNQAQRYARTLWDSGYPDGIVFKIDGPANGVKTDALTNYWDEKELLVSGDFEVTEVEQKKGAALNSEYAGRRVFEVTLKPVAKPEQVAELPVEQPELAQEPTSVLDDLSMSYDLKDYNQVSGQLGSNKGGIFEDSTGKQIYVKEPKTDLHGDNEVLASALYELAGVPAVKVRNGELADGTKVTFSEMVPNSNADFADKVNDPEYRKKVQDGFVVDAWLANWDVAGTGFDNIVSDANDEPVRVDPGGALLFRAQGAPKGNAFNDKVTELDTLVDPSQNQWSAKTFQDMSEEDKVESAKKLLDISDEDIDNYVNASITDEEARTKLSELLKARRQTILNRYSLEEGAEDGRGEQGEPAGDAGDTGGPRPDAEVVPTEEGVGGRGDRDGESPWSSLDNPLPEPARAQELKNSGYSVPQLFELDPQKDAEAFKNAMLKLKENNKFSASVFIYEIEEYKNMRLFSTADGTAGLALKPDGDIVSGFVHGDSPHKKSIVSMVSQMVELGGDRLDAYDTVLPGIYAQAGFRPISRVKWNDEESDSNWDKETYKIFNNGEPDVVAMAYDPERVGSEYDASEGKYFEDYGDAMDARNQWIEDRKLSAPEEPTKLTGYDLAQTDDGVYYPKTRLTSDDLFALSSGQKVPPSLPFIPTNTNSGETMYFDSTGVRRWGQYGASGALLRRQNEDGEFEFLITKRSNKTSTSPDKWSVPGGAHSSKTDVGTQVTARNELSEELGLALSDRAITSYLTNPAPDWYYSYELMDVENLDNYEFKLSDEIADTKWVSAEELSRMQANDELHEDFNEEVVSGLIEFSNNNNYSPSTISSTKWWKHDKEENGNLIQFASKMGSALEVGDIINYRGSDLLVTSQTKKNSKYGAGIVNLVDPATGEKTNVVDLRKQGPFPVLSNNQSAQEQLKVATGESAYNPTSGKIIDSANVDSPKSKSELGFSDYKLYTISAPNNKNLEVAENVDSYGSLSYGVPSEGINIFAEIKPKGTNIFDAYVNLNKPELKQKYSFETLEEAKTWVGENLASSFGSEKNVITGESLGEFSDIKPHKGGFLKPASPAQADLVKKLLESKQVDPELKEKINAQLLKEDYVGGEAGVHISQLKALQDLPEEEAKANFTSSQDTTLDPSFTPDTSDSEIFVTRPEDELDPAKIIDALRKSHLNSYSLDNGDLVIGTREYTTAYNKSYKYEVVVRRTKDQERFFAYVRKTDMQTGDISVLRASKDGHSYKTMMRKLASVKQGILFSSDPNTWFNKKKSSVESLAPDFDLSEQIDLVVSSNTKEELEDRIKEILATVGGSSFNINKAVISKLENFVADGTLSKEYVDDVFQRMVSSKMQQANDVPDYLLGNIDKIPPYPHMSFNGRQIKEGDTVDWTDIKTGQVLRGKVKHVKYRHGTKGYVYSDQVLVEFPDLEKQRWRVSANLVVVDDGDPMTPAFYAKNYEYNNPEQVIDASPEGQRVAPQAKQVTPEPTPTATTEPEVTPSLVLETSTPKLENGFLKINDSTAVVPNSPGLSLARIISGTKTSKKMSELELGDYVVIGEMPEGGPNADEVLFNGSTADGKNVVVTHKSFGTDAGRLYVLDKDSMADVSLTVTVPTKKNSYQDFDSVNNNPPQKPSLPSLTPPSDQLANQAVVMQEVIQTSVNNNTDGQKMAESVGDLKDLSSSVVKKANELSDKSSPVFDPEYGNYNVRFIDGADVITRTTKKDKANFTLEKMSYSGLKVGDIVSKSTGDKTVYLQIVQESSSSSHPVVRRVRPPKNSMYAYYQDQKKTQIEDGIDRAQKEFVGYYNLKVYRPTKEFKDSGYVKKVEKPKLPAPTGGTVNGISVFASEAEFMANTVEHDSEDFYESYGIPEDIDGVSYEKISSGASSLQIFRQSYGKLQAKMGEGFTVASIGEVVKKLEPNVDTPSFGVVISASPYSINANSVDKIPVPEIQWMSGPLAGEKQEISNLEDRAYITFPSNYKKIYLPIEKAKELGVKFNEAQLEEANKAIEEQLNNLKEALKSKLESEAKQKEISKLKTKNTDFGSGVGEVEPATILAWDESDFEDTPSLESVLSKMSQDPALATRGQDVLVDASDVEDNKIKVFKVIDGIGPMEDRKRMTRFAFSLNSWVTDERKGSKGLVGDLLERMKNGDTDVSYYSPGEDLRVRKFSKYTKKEQDEVVSGKPAQNGELLAENSYWHLSSGQGATYKVEIKNSAGDSIGYYLLHRSNSDAKTPTFIGAGAKKSPIAFHNKVDLYLNDNATPEEIETALKATGIKQARPATKNDIKVLNENKIISLFGVKNNGAVNYSGALREKILKDTYDKYGIRAEDMEPVEKNGDIQYLLPKEQGEKLATLLNTKYLNHSFRESGGVTDDGKADFLFNLLTSDGLKSTVKRWEGGINTNGMSSSADTLRVGANYVFMTKTSNEPSTGMANVQMLFDVNEVFRRLDFYANQDDKFGAKQNKNMVDVIASSSNLYEVLFKGSVSLDMLSKLNINSVPVRESLRKKLLDNGIDTIGSRTVEEILGPAPEKPSATPGTVQFEYENGDLEVEKVEAVTLTSGDLIVVDGTVAKISTAYVGGSNSKSMTISLDEGVPYMQIEVDKSKKIEKIVQLATPGTLQFDYENNNLKVEEVAANTLKDGDLVDINGKISTITDVEPIPVPISQGEPKQVKIYFRYENGSFLNNIFDSSKKVKKIVGGSDDVKLLENGMQAYFNPADGKWYKDSAFTIPASQQELTK